MNLVWSAFLALGGVTGSALFFAALKRWPLVGVVSIAISVGIAWEFPNPPSIVNVAGTSIYFLDLLSFSMLMIGAFRFNHIRRNLGSLTWFWVGLGFLLFISLACGLAQNPVGKTINEFRSYLYPFAAMSWAMALSWDGEAAGRLIRKFSATVGWLLVFIAAFHFALYGPGSTSEFVDAGTGFEQTTRPLISGQALMILLCGITNLWFWHQSREKKLLLSGAIFLAVALLSQQRTVWAVGLAATLMVFVVARGRTKISLVIGLIAVAFMAAFVSVVGAIPEITERLGSAAADSGTYDARVRSWTNLIQQSMLGGPSQVLFGQPMGMGFGRYEGAGRWVEFAPHNWYVTVYLRAGAVGLLLLVVFMFSLLYRALRNRDNMASVAIVFGVISYGWSYSWPWYVCLFWGWAIACASPSRKARSNVDPISGGLRANPLTPLDTKGFRS